MDSETKFLSGLIKLGYGENVVEELRQCSKKVSWARGWPKKKKSFWNAEAFMWGYKISTEKRGIIADELKFLVKGKNLDLGCGAYSYLPSVGFDLSEKMLQFNEQCLQKVKGDLEKKLPFSKNSFDSVTAVFVLNYVEKYDQLLREVGRVLKEEGAFVAVLFKGKINEWQRQKEVNEFSLDQWSEIMGKTGLSVQGYEKENLWFLVCRKRKVIKG